MSVKNRLKRIVYSNSFLEKIYDIMVKKYTRGGYSIENEGYGRYTCDVIGKNNKIMIGNDTIFKIRGNDNQIIIDENCTIGPKCSFWIEGQGSMIHIEKQSTFTHTVHFCAQ